jgi:hypothetical protein
MNITLLNILTIIYKNKIFLNKGYFSSLAVNFCDILTNRYILFINRNIFITDHLFFNDGTKKITNHLTLVRFGRD